MITWTSARLQPVGRSATISVRQAVEDLRILAVA
jgi:hypothetical protein